MIGKFLIAVWVVAILVAVWNFLAPPSLIWLDMKTKSDLLGFIILFAFGYFFQMVTRNDGQSN